MMSERFTAEDVHPVMTMGGIMPGGSEMTNWYNHVPFPNPAQLALKRAELLAEIDALIAEKEQAATATLRVIPGGTPEVEQAA